MGVFSRVKDIVSSNINAMLDHAEDPEKMIRLMIQEMEDTLVEIKAACAGAMATRKRVGRELAEAANRSDRWAERAQMAVDKGRDDLAREALIEKKRVQDKTAALENELAELDVLVGQHQDDITQLEQKLDSVRERQRVLLQRHLRAKNKKRAQSGIRRFDTSDALARFEIFENRVERMEAEADLVNFGRRPNLEDEIDRLWAGDDVERELAELKAKKAGAEQDQAD